MQITPHRINSTVSKIFDFIKKELQKHETIHSQVFYLSALTILHQYRHRIVTITVQTIKHIFIKMKYNCMIFTIKKDYL